MLCKWCIWYHNTARQAPPIPHSKGTGSAIHLQRKGSCQARILPPVPSAQATDCTLLPSKLLSWLPPHYCYMLLAQDSLLGKAISPQRSISWKTINLSQHSVSELPRQLCWAAMTIKKKKKKFKLLSGVSPKEQHSHSRCHSSWGNACTACISAVVMHPQIASSLLR